MKEMTNEDVKQLMNDAFNVFFAKYRNLDMTRDSPQWDECFKDLNSLMEKYKEFEHIEPQYDIGGSIKTVKVYTANIILFWFYDLLNRRAQKRSDELEQAAKAGNGKIPKTGK